MLEVALILLAGIGGLWFTFRHVRRNVLELRSRPKGSVKVGDLILNQGLSFLWYAYLAAFFTGLMVNNLLLK